MEGEAEVPKVVQELKWEVWRRTSNYLEQVLRKVLEEVVI